MSLIFLAFQGSAFAQDFSGIGVPENSVIVLAVAAEGIQTYRDRIFPVELTRIAAKDNRNE
jgi:hypothetical protein